MTMTHTPAPWTLNPGRSTRVDLIDNAKGEAIGEIVWVDVRNPADARLIAAAPDLLEALHYLAMQASVLAPDDAEHPIHRTLATARAAIAKAKGAA